MSEFANELRDQANQHPLDTDIDKFLVAADTIEQLQQRNAELERDIGLLRKSNARICGEQSVTEQERDELAATVERFVELRDYLPNVRQLVIEFEKLVHKTPRQNLNALKREVIIDALNYSDGRYIETHSDHLDMIVEYANTKYPIDKELVMKLWTPELASGGTNT